MNINSSYLKTLSSAVEKAVTGAVQGVLGEEFSKHYETPKDSTASGGHELSWKIFPGISRKNQQEVSIFVFDKEDLKRFKKKETQERILEVLRQEMKTLRLLRHPNVLKVEEVYEESRRTLSFVTERITCSLANACKDFTNIGNVTPDVLDIGLTEFEVACGLMHIGGALSFLHREGRRVHLSLGPHSVFITPAGEWKLGGMGFCRVVEPGKTSRSEYYALDCSTGTKNPITGKLEGTWEPPLEYCAPEVVSDPRVFNSSADMFSLGLLAFELFTAPRADGGRNPIIDVRDGNRMSYTYKVQSMHPIQFPSTVPVSLQNTIRSLLALEPNQRPEARAFLASQFFDSGPIKTLRTLQALVEHDPATQAKFLTTLPTEIEGFSTRVLRDMVIPGLKAVVINQAVAPFVVTPLLKIVAKVDKFTFESSIGPMMIPLLAITEPVQCMLMFVSELEVLIPKANDAYIRDHIVPMLCRALDSTVPEILDTVLNKIVDQASLFEYRILKQVILPRVNKLILSPPQPSVRVNALVWLAKSFHVFDKDLLVESVLPTLAETLKEDKTPAVCMCILGCYDNLGKHLGPEYMAKLIIPHVAPLLWEQTLNNTQFDCVCEKIQDMLKAVIQERDKAFMAESSVKTVRTGITAASGMASAVQAVEANKDRASGMDAANRILSEEYVPAKPKVSDDKPERPLSPYKDDPFILGSNTRSSSSTSKAAPTQHEEEPAEEGRGGRRRHVKKAAGSRRAGRAKSRNEEADLLELGSSNTQNTSTVTSDLMGLSVNSSQSNVGMGNGAIVPGNAMFNGLSMGGANSAGGMYQQPQQQMNYNSAAMQMTPYGLQGQQFSQQSNGYGNMSGGGYPQQQFNNMNGPNTQMLQIQGGYNNNQQFQSSQDKFSAFDGL